MKSVLAKMGQTRFNLMDLIFSNLTLMMLIKFNFIVFVLGLILMSTVYYLVKDLWENRDEAKNGEWDQ